MRKNTGNFDDIFEEQSENPELEDWEQDEESKYWIHRTIAPTLYFNTNFKDNGCPMVITEQELNEYISQGKSIKNCHSIDVFYNDNKTKLEVIKKLNESNLSQDDFEYQLVNKLTELYQSYFATGLYMPDIYSKELERTAHQYSVKKMERMITRHNFGFNSYRGEMNVGIILEIPIEDQDKIYEHLETPIEYGTEYYGITKISDVVSPKYIKGMVVKYGRETFYIKNPNFILTDKSIEESLKNNNETQEQDLYLYHTEELIEKVIFDFINSKLPNDKRVVTYTNRIEQIEKEFRKYARQIVGFVGSERYKQVIEYLRTIPRIAPFIEDGTKGNGINMIMAKKYYDELATKLESSFGQSDTPKKL